MRYPVGSCPICSIVYPPGEGGFANTRGRITETYEVLTNTFNAEVVLPYNDQGHDQIRIGLKWWCELIKKQGEIVVHIPFGSSTGCYVLSLEYIMVPPDIANKIRLIPKEDDLFLDA